MGGFGSGSTGQQRKKRTVSGDRSALEANVNIPEIGVVSGFAEDIKKDLQRQVDALAAAERPTPEEETFAKAQKSIQDRPGRQQILLTKRRRGKTVSPSFLTGLF